MAKYLVEDTSLIAIADAIRSKTNNPDKLSLEEMADVIVELGVGGDTETTATLNALIDRSITEIRSDVEGVGSYAFYNCSRLTTANFPVATSIGSNAFYNCSQLTTADFPAVTSISSSAFYNCSQLTTADFPVTTSISSSAFYGCSKLTTADFPAVTSISSSAFQNCSRLTTANFPVATSIGSSAFYNCLQLTTADFPAVTSIGSQAFQNCSQLNIFTLRSETLCSLTSTSAFSSTPIASGTGYIYVPSSLIDSYKSATNWSTYAAQFRALEDYTVDVTITGELDANKIGA